MLLLPLGPFFQGGSRLGTPGQDAFDGIGAEGPVADSAFQGGDHILGRINGQQGQHAMRLAAA